MIPFLVDHCFDEDILRAVQRKAARDGLSFDDVLAREVHLERAEDEKLLVWAAENSRVILTHDRNTLIGLAHERTRRGLPTSGVLIVDDFAPQAQVVDDILLCAHSTDSRDWEGQVHYVPL